MKKSKRQSPPPEITAENSKTRERLLDVAGQLFAEKGFDRTTSKEITEQAGANSAAVNYHFGGIEGLYAAVLEEAASLRVKSADLQAAVAGQLDAKAKLEAYLRQFVQVLTSPAASSWRLRVLIREFTAPTLTNQTQHREAPAEKARVLKGIISELMGLPEEHPAVARGCVSIVAPCFMLLLCDRHMLRQALPQFSLKPESAPDLLQHMVQFALAGLAAVANDVQHGKGR
ncbi:DUF1956 domain-containing protein [bacterium]|nr:DUF1956 domain-containing protein [bacterium]